MVGNREFDPLDEVEEFLPVGGVFDAEGGVVADFELGEVFGVDNAGRFECFDDLGGETDG
jgi:hypothetical protein